jgi:hypothetical protein
MKKLILLTGVCCVLGAISVHADDYIVTLSTDPTVTKTPITVVSVTVDNGVKVRREISGFYEEEKAKLVNLEKSYSQQIDYINSQVAATQLKIDALDKAIVDSGGKVFNP